MFALSRLGADSLRVSLKCEPQLAAELRGAHAGVLPGYHLNKRHWNTVIIDGSLSEQMIRDMIEDSYDLVVSHFPQSRRRALRWQPHSKPTPARQPGQPVAAALAAISSGDASSLRRLLDSDPELVQVEVGAGGSLLGEVAEPDVFGTSFGHALGVDRACVDVLIEAGSDLDGPLNVAACFDRLELVEILLAAGGRADATGTHGITPLQSAVYHASRASVDVLSAVALVPDAPWIAAGAGRVDRLERFLDGRGRLVAEAYQHRPNPADVGWLHRAPPRDVPQEVLDEALVHAAHNERPRAVAWLLRHGADPNAGPYQGCGALHLAAAFGALESVRLLIAAGTDVDRTNDFNGDNALGWAEYVLARERPNDTGVAAVRDLLRSLGSHPVVWGA
jgi:predicted DNA-binding protein (MmcQ/YjbR family)/ankyrin repeat protein